MDPETGVRPEPVARRRPAWWAVAAGAAVVVLLVVAVVVAAGRDPSREARPRLEVAGPATDRAGLPDLTGRTEPEALTGLKELGVQVWDIRYRHAPGAAGLVVGQSLPPGLPLDPARPLTLEVGMALTAPVITAPLGIPVVPAGVPVPALTWEPGDRPPPYPPRWRVRLFPQLCHVPGGLPSGNSLRCEFRDLGTVTVVEGTPRFELDPLQEGATVPLIGVRYGLGFFEAGHQYFSGWVQAWVEPLDHFDNPGPASQVAVLRVGLRQP